MDPQKLSQLDPKLREAYERVMGTAIPKSQSQPEPKPIPSPIGEPALEPQPVPEPQPAINPQQPQFIPTSEPVIPIQPEVPAPVATTATATPNFTAPAPQTQTIVLKKKRGMMMPVLFGITGLIFIVIYTLFWTKIFNFKLPFLP